jgi:hypothetical protein
MRVNLRVDLERRQRAHHFRVEIRDGARRQFQRPNVALAGLDHSLCPMKSNSISKTPRG